MIIYNGIQGLILGKFMNLSIYITRRIKKMCKNTKEKTPHVGESVFNINEHQPIHSHPGYH
jgi:hypothetical protein